MGVRETLRTSIARQRLLTRWQRCGPEVEAAYAAVHERLQARAREAKESRNVQELPPPAAIPFVWPTLQWTLLRSWQDASWMLVALTLPAAFYLIHILAGWLVLGIRVAWRWFG